MDSLQHEERVCVFVANLPSILSNLDITQRLQAVFAPYGRISHIKTSRDGKGRPFAFVQFEGQSMDFALTKTITMEGRVLRFERAKSTPHPSIQSQQSFPSILDADPFVYYPSLHLPINPTPLPLDESNKVAGRIVDHNDASPSTSSAFKVFVGHLNGETVTQRKLLRHFQRHGHITDIELFKRNIDGTPRRDAFAFISYLKEDQQLRAIREENEQMWLGQRIKCYKALPKKEQSANVSSPEETTGDSEASSSPSSVEDERHPTSTLASMQAYRADNEPSGHGHSARAHLKYNHGMQTQSSETQQQSSLSTTAPYYYPSHLWYPSPYPPYPDGGDYYYG